MITVTLPDRVLSFSFSHPTKKVPLEPADVKEGGPHYFNQRLSCCHVFDKSMQERIVPLTTSVHKWPKWDPFSKETGRKLALKWALRELGLGKYDRIQVWKEYKLHHRTKVLSDIMTVIH